MTLMLSFPFLHIENKKVFQQLSITPHNKDTWVGFFKGKVVSHLAYE